MEGAKNLLSLLLGPSVMGSPELRQREQLGGGRLQPRASLGSGQCHTCGGMPPPDEDVSIWLHLGRERSKKRVVKGLQALAKWMVLSKSSVPFNW